MEAFAAMLRAADDVLVGPTPMYNNQGPNIQGSQTINNPTFYYNTTTPPQPEPRTPSWIETAERVREFTDRYYKTFCHNPVGLADYYREDSRLTFDGEEFKGSRNIIAKFTSLPYRQVKHNISHLDHRQLDSGGILINVLGELVVGRRRPALNFSQMFRLMPSSQGSMYIARNIFRTKVELMNRTRQNTSVRPDDHCEHLSINKSQMRTDVEVLVRAFVDQYYTTFCNNPAGLAIFYRDDSLLTFEGETIQGLWNIIAKLTSLPYHQCQYINSSFDCLDSGSGSIFIYVNGELLVGDRPPTLIFNQTFNVMPTSEGTLGFYIVDDLFRFIAT